MRRRSVGLRAPGYVPLKRFSLDLFTSRSLLEGRVGVSKPQGGNETQHPRRIREGKGRGGLGSGSQGTDKRTLQVGSRGLF